MADPLSIIASAITVGATAAQLSLALFNITQTIRNAPEEISEIAQEISTLSASLVVLGEVLHWHQDICKPELFEQIRSTLCRFHPVEEQLNRLTKRTRLKSLKWFFRGPKAKGLLKKVESVKSALNLILNIIRLAAEATTRQQPSTVYNQAHQQLAQTSPILPLPSPNRFRKVVESVVQANRLTVETAQKLDAENPKRGHYNEIQRWQSDSNDTATWLYHLVFSPDSTTPEQSTEPKRLQRSYSVTVEDYDSDASQASKTTTTIKGPLENTLEQQPDPSSQVIVWNNRTEPTFVVDRLLHSWTHLNDSQIQESKTPYPSGQDKAVGDALADESNGHTINIKFSSNSANASPISDASSFSDGTDWEYMDELGPKGYVPHLRIPSPPPPPPPPPPPRAKNSHTRDSKLGADDKTRGVSSSKPEFLRHPAKSKPTPNTSSFNLSNPSRPHQFNGQYSTSSERYNPFQAPLMNPHLATLPPWNSAENNFTAPPLYHMSPPFYPPSYPPLNTFSQTQPPMIPPRPYSPAHSLSTYYTASPPPSPPLAPKNPNEDLILSKLTTIMTQKLENVEALILGQGTAHTENNIEEPETITLPGESNETEIDSKIERLEQLLLEQMEDQIRRQEASEAAWKAEKAESVAKAEKEAEESRKLAEREIAAAKAAKKAAEKMLKYAKEQAAKRARDQAEAKAAEERRKIDEDYRKRIDVYEEQLAAFTTGLQEFGDYQDRRVPSAPLRTTRISEGDRQIEVSEFTTERLEPFITSQVMPKSFIQEDFLNTNSTASRYQSRPYSDRHCRNSLNGSIRHLKSSTMQGLEEARSLERVILLPSQIDRSSAGACELQTTLENCGVPTTFDELENRNDNALVQSEAGSNELIRSTIFWEPPLRSIGSELLGTLRFRNWKPFYIRKSDAGQTYFLGSQPVHVHFFKPEYQPQFKESRTPSDTECILIAKDMVEEYALLEFGFPVKPMDSGNYALDCRLTVSDIEALIDRSFMIRETHFRRQHRQLQWAPYNTISNTADEDPEPSLASEMTTITKTASEDYHDQESMFEDNTPITSPTDDEVLGSSQVRNVMDISLYNANTVVEEDNKGKLPSATSTGLENRVQLRLRPAKLPPPPPPPQQQQQHSTPNSHRGHHPALPNTSTMGFHVQHQMHQYTLIPRVLYVRRWGLKRWSLAFGRKGRVTYN
ncbi:hypothetical protein K505DRAFT_377814 [Melanomma pulvis-pyrius CBS 109.77]|uniref:Fungal N-terminal domain-containing protein n=1 Tax=Melanomma pulvis-pyrius CBS 109.77 TaxID=1314802 RepID=A0A6A6X102_9PLEO|nr:hypothetical protein K505DRAFT_377814 [Melanomma pulvis-pyrius CBS 109.77]